MSVTYLERTEKDDSTWTAGNGEIRNRSNVECQVDKGKQKGSANLEIQTHENKVGNCNQNVAKYTVCSRLIGTLDKYPLKIQSTKK